MLFHHNYFKKHCHVGENIFLILAAEWSLILDFYPQNFSWRRQLKFYLKRDWSKEHEVYHLQWIGLFQISSR